MKDTAKITKTTNSKSKYSAPALEKGLDILEYLSMNPEGETLTSISDGISKSKSEIFRMIAVLERRGYVKRLPDNENYILSSKLFHLGTNRPTTKYLLKVAFPIMEEFAKEVRQGCHLTIQTGNEIVVIARVESPERYGMSVRTGHRLPMFGSPSGHCITAFSRREEMDNAIARLKTVEGLKTSKKFEKELEEIRTAGYCIMENGFALGVTGVSAPIMDLHQSVCVAALTSAILHFVKLKNFNTNFVAEKLKFYADQLSVQYSNQ